jgi:hypothetical protein
LIGLKVKLDRDVDQQQPCCENIATIHPGKAQHAGELRCAHCDRHRGWIPHATRNFILETVRRFGAPREPIIVRQHQQEKKVAFQQKPNTGAIFVNDRKTAETHPDRTGSALIDGREYYVNAWLNKTKDGKPYLNLTFKPKVEQASSKKPIREDLNDEIPAF